MLLNVTSLAAEELAIANTPEIGAESVLRVTDKEFENLFSLRNTNDSTADVAAVTGVSFPLALSESRHLHLRADTACPYDTAIVVTLSVTLDDNTSTTVTATLEVPDWADQTIKSCPIGSAVDFVDSLGDPLTDTIKSIDSITSIEGGVTGVLNRLSIWSSPPEASFAYQGCTRSKSFDLQLPSSVSIPCGYNNSQYVKKGRSEEVEAEFEFVHFSSWSGMARLNGGRCSLLVEVIKDDTVPWERVVLTGHRPNASPSRGDGDDEVLATSSGPYESFLLFSSR